MVSSAAQQSRQTSELQRALAARAASSKSATSTAENAFADIKANPIYQALHSAEVRDEDKPAALAAIFAAPTTELEARATMKHYEQLKSYVAAQREALAVAMIKVQQSETQVELQRSLKDLNQAMLDFEVQLKPTTDVLKAINTLTMTDKAYDAFKEIKRDQSVVEAAKAQRKAIEAKINEAAARVSILTDENLRLENDKNIFRQIRGPSAAQIAVNNAELAQIQLDLSSLRDQLTKTNAEIPPSELSEDLLESKAVIAKFLDLSDESVREQQEQMFNTALTFIQNNKDRVGNMRKLLSNDEASILKMVDASGVLGIMYATMSDGCGMAIDKLRERRSALLPKEGEVLGAVEKQIRAKKLSDLDAYIETFEKERGNTLLTTAAVTALQEKLNNLKRSNADGLELTRIMNTDAIAEVSESICTTLTSLSTAAIGQSANIAKDNLRRMNELTNKIAQDDSIRNAMGEEKRVTELAEGVEALNAWTEILNTRSTILEGTFNRYKETRNNLMLATENTRAARDEAASIAARIVTDDQNTTADSNTNDLLSVNR